MDEEDKLKKVVWEKSLHLLSFREHGVEELRRKLRQRCYPEGLIEETLLALVEADWLSDKRAVEQYVRNRLRKGYGLRRVKDELRAKGFPPALVEDALEELQEMKVDARYWIQKWASRGLEERKVIARLQRKGFDWSEIKSALSEFGSIDE